MVRHLENAAQVGGLVGIEEEIAVRSIGIAGRATAEEAEGHQRIEKVARRTRMQTKALAETFERFRTIRQRTEHTDLDGAEQCFRGPERQAGLQDLVRSGLLRHAGHQMLKGSQQRPWLRVDASDSGSPRCKPGATAASLTAAGALEPKRGRVCG